MNTAIVLSGGSGTRLGADIPKQYIEIAGEPVFIRPLRTLQQHNDIDRIIIVANDGWWDFIKTWLDKCGIDKFAGFAPAGSSRQHSVLNGLTVAAETGTAPGDIVCILEAARPFTGKAEISAAIREITDNRAVPVDASVPVIPSKDTAYISADGTSIDSIPERKALWNALVPECFIFDRIFALLSSLDDESLATATSTIPLAFRSGMNVRLVKGDDHNYKITTAADLQRFKNDVSR